MNQDEIEDEGITIDEVIQRTAEEEKKFESFWIGIQNGIDAHTENANFGGIKHLTHRKKKVNKKKFKKVDMNSLVLINSSVNYRLIIPGFSIQIIIVRFFGIFYYLDLYFIQSSSFH